MSPRSFSDYIETMPEPSASPAGITLIEGCRFAAPRVGIQPMYTEDEFLPLSGLRFSLCSLSYSITSSTY